MTYIVQELQQYMPSEICESCYKELTAFLTYRSRLKHVGMLVLGLAYLKNGQAFSLEEYFRNHHTELLSLLQELHITEKQSLSVQDLMEELSTALNSVQDANRKRGNSTSGQQDKECEKTLHMPCKNESLEVNDGANASPLPGDKERTEHICKTCKEAFNTKRDYLQHKRTTHRDHMCDTCGLAFDTKFVLETHRKRHETVRPYKCEYCSLEYFTKAETQLHVRRLHLKAFEVSCSECALTFRTKQMLAQHMKTHSNQRTHTCNVCGFSFKSHTHLNRHTKELHQGVMFKCEHCSASYRRKDKLRMHVEKMHNIQTYFVCDICLQSYDKDEKLQEHKAHHQKPKDLQCAVCLGAYITKEEFDEHLCITYRENYICCERDFKYHFFYNKHMFLEHGVQTNVRVKPVDGILLGQYRAKRKQTERCLKCEQEFPTRQQKKTHMKTCGMVQYYDAVDVIVHEGTGTVLQTLQLTQLLLSQGVFSFGQPCYIGSGSSRLTSRACIAWLLSNPMETVRLWRTAKCRPPVQVMLEPIVRMLRYRQLAV
uniref:C2H2-type domain-containing protein n=1 Tax=Anopheles christyi TaxID=43041 RepID=A0A182JPT9_9DIPT